MAIAENTDGDYKIDPARMAPYEPVALVLTLLAFPEDGPPTPALDQRYAETCAYVLRSRAEADHAWAEELQPIRPAHALVSHERAAGGRQGASQGAERTADSGAHDDRVPESAGAPS